MTEPLDSLYEEPAFYRMLFRERTADSQAYLARCEGVVRVLELGAGEGRVSFALAAAGHEVVAVERSGAMLEGLEARRAEHPDAAVRAVRADARGLRLGERFLRVLLPFNAIAHFHTEADVLALLDAATDHLSPGGRFLFDARVGEPTPESGSSAVARLVHPRTGAVCRLEEHQGWDPTRGVLTLRTELVERRSGQRQSLCLSLRQRSDAEIEALLGRGGWRIDERDDLGDAVLYDCVRAR